MAEPHTPLHRHIPRRVTRAHERSALGPLAIAALTGIFPHACDRLDGLIQRIVPETEALGPAAGVGVGGEGGGGGQGAAAGHGAAGLAQRGARGEGVGAVALAAVLGAEEGEVLAGAVGGAGGVGHIVGRDRSPG